jgi:ferredoxin
MVVRYSVEFELPDGRDLDGDGPRGRACAARRAGFALPNLCEQGWDLACAVRVLHGELDHSDARRYYDEDERGGFALICTAKARS